MSTLFLITTPIGNLGDITYRAREFLAQHSLFYVEDTRSFHQLLALLQIDAEGKKIYSYHDHSSTNRCQEIIRWLEKGFDVGFASEAGSPILCDPAFPVVRAALAGNHQLESLGGISSALVALELSGLPPDPFVFLGFLPRDLQQAHQLLTDHLGSTSVFFESPHRILPSLDYLAACFPLGQFSVGRELTKKFQSVYRFLGEQWHHCRDQFVAKGEVVVVFRGDRSNELCLNGEKLQQLATSYLERPNIKALSKLLAAILPQTSSEIYRQLTGPQK